eukprot:6076455-Pyramimonas_sp.AAC.1
MACYIRARTFSRSRHSGLLQALGCPRCPPDWPITVREAPTGSRDNRRGPQDCPTEPPKTAKRASRGPREGESW